MLLKTHSNEVLDDKPSFAREIVKFVVQTFHNKLIL